jgi:hypothetical protein
MAAMQQQKRNKAPGTVVAMSGHHHIAVLMKARTITMCSCINTSSKDCATEITDSALVTMIDMHHAMGAATPSGAAISSSGTSTNTALRSGTTSMFAATEKSATEWK